MSKVLVLYYSSYGHIEQMAEAVAAGAREAGATVDIKRVPETAPEEVAKVGFEAMMSGEASVIAGWKNKLEATVANVLPNETLAAQHRKMAEPGTARSRH